MESLLHRMSPRLPQSIWSRYALTVLLVGVTALLRFILDPFLYKYPFLVFIPAIFLVSILFDHGAGFIAVILSGICSAWFFMKPTGLLWVSEPGDQLAFLIYMGLGFAIAAVCETLRRTLDQLRQSGERLSAANEEKDLMLHEIHHRIRNDLQQISAQLTLAARRSENAADIVNGTIERIGLLARVYGRLRRVEGVNIVNAKDFLVSLTEDIQLGIVGVRPVALGADVEEVDLDMAIAVAVGTIANELITNALKYAFPDGQAGRIDLAFRRADGHYVLSVCDDGAGITSDQPQGTGLGGRIMQQFALQLRGTLELRPQPQGGVHATLRFPAGDQEAPLPRLAGEG